MNTQVQFKWKVVLFAIRMYPLRAGRIKGGNALQQLKTELFVKGITCVDQRRL